MPIEGQKVRFWWSSNDEFTAYSSSNIDALVNDAPELKEFEIVSEVED